LIGQQLGSYRIDSELGSGGMGTVYLAEDTKAGRQVALKVVHPHLLATPGFFKRFMQEAELGKRVRHENVVRTFDVDALLVDDKQVHFMVMEYVEGKSLRELLTDLRTIPETLLREIALQTVAGLAAIHEQGIVHRDLKPENILITDDHEIRIMDLGVAKLQEASIALTTEGQFAGSLLYAAPEQFRRDEEVGLTSDLYSLGVLLYELATGQNPFLSDDVSAVIQAQLTEVPPPAHERNDNLSLFFSELIATLLAKQVAERFASAGELHSVLDEAEHSAWWTDRAPALREQHARLPKIRVNRETKLHGRDANLQVLDEAWDRARTGDGNTVFLEGEAGIGKTRLVDAFLRGLGDEDGHILYGSYPPSGGLGGLSDAVVGKFGEARLADTLTPYLSATPSLVPTFAALIKHESAPTGAEPLAGDALQTVVVHLMRALATDKPTVWILDDLHFAPQESHDFFLAMARAVEDHRILLVGTARPGVGLEDFAKLDNFRRTTLDRLGARQIFDVLEDAFRSEALAEKLGGKIAKKSDGVPFFIFEMIRGLKEGQFIKQQPDGTYVQTQVIEEIEVPSAVKDLIEGRMRGLTENQRAILDAGAVCGLTFEPGLVAQVVEEKRVRVLRELAEIERRHGLVRGEEHHVRFDHNQIQEVLYGDLMPDLRREYHTLMAEAHAERCGAKPVGDDAVFLVHHYLRGSQPGQALAHLEAALDHLEQGYRNDAVLDLAGRALQAKGLLDAEARVRVLLRQAGRLDLLGRREEERAALDEAGALADRTDDAVLQARARQALGGLLHALSDNEAARVAFEEARELARAAGDRELEAGTTGNLGNALRALGRHADAQEHHEHARELSRAIGYRRGEAVAMGNLGGVLNDLGHHAEAQEQFERARALNHEIGNRQGEAIATGNLGIVFGDLGRYDEAQEHYERHRALSSAIGFRQGEAIATANLGNLFMSLGRYAEAQEHHRLARTLFREIGFRVGEAITEGNLGNLNCFLGRHAEAREHYERVGVLSREIGFRPGEGDALAGLASLAEAEEASRLHEQALALRRELGESNVAETLVALGRLECSRGETENAATHLNEALVLAQEISNPEAILSATVERARLPDGDVEAALAALAEHEQHATHGARMEARFRLWELTQDRAHLAEAQRLLQHLRDHAPEEDRDSMVRNVPLYRDVAGGSAA
jgi:predicted ATPase/predicted Ser/Thr protein kinase